MLLSHSTLSMEIPSTHISILYVYTEAKGSFSFAFILIGIGSGGSSILVRPHCTLLSRPLFFFFFFLTTARHKRLIRYSVDVHGGPIEQSTSGTIIRKIPSQPPRVPATLRAASFSRHDRAPVSRVSVYFIRERPTKGPYYYRKEYYTGRVQVYEHTRPSSSSSTRPVIRRDVTETGYISCGYPTNICVYIYEI